MFEHTKSITRGLAATLMIAAGVTATAQADSLTWPAAEADLRAAPGTHQARPQDDTDTSLLHQRQRSLLADEIANLRKPVYTDDEGPAVVSAAYEHSTGLLNELACFRAYPTDTVTGSGSIYAGAGGCR